jgi:hypothetical protein
MTQALIVFADRQTLSLFSRSTLDSASRSKYDAAKAFQCNATYLHGSLRHQPQLRLWIVMKQHLKMMMRLWSIAEAKRMISNALKCATCWKIMCVDLLSRVGFLGHFMTGVS